jgi:hypothetical protein
MTAAARRQRRYRQRQAAGLVALEIEVDEATACHVLEQVGLLDPGADHDRDDLARAVERLLVLLDRDA